MKAKVSQLRDQGKRKRFVGSSLERCEKNFHLWMEEQQGPEGNPWTRGLRKKMEKQGKVWRVQPGRFHLSWKKGEHGKSRSEKKPLQVVDIDRKVEEEEQQGEDNHRCIKAKRSARADVEGGGNLAGERDGGGHGGWQTFYEKTPKDDSSAEDLSGSSQQIGGPIA